MAHAAVEPTAYAQALAALYVLDWEHIGGRTSQQTVLGELDRVLFSLPSDVLATLDLVLPDGGAAALDVRSRLLVAERGTVVDRGRAEEIVNLDVSDADPDGGSVLRCAASKSVPATQATIAVATPAAG